AKYIVCIELAGSRGADLVVLPELSLQGYLYQLTPDWTLPSEELEYHYANAEPVPGETTRILTEHARRHDLHVIVGLTVRSEGYGGTTCCLLNTAVILGPPGFIGVYRMDHSPGGEDHQFPADNAFPV